MDKIKINFGTFIWRITATHTIAYFVAGIFALLVLRYDEIFGIGTLSFMRPTDSSWVAAGPGLQVIRGLLLSLFLFPFRTIFFETEKGWIKFWSIPEGDQLGEFYSGAGIVHSEDGNIKFSPDGKFLAVAATVTGSNAAVQVWTLE